MTHKIYVDGQEGTTGLRLLDYLSKRDDIELLRIDEAKRKDPVERGRLLNAADLAFLCLPDAASREAVTLLENPDTCVIDASTAFRIDPAWVYGLPELAPGQREKLRATKRIANPGCHATAFILLVRPLVDAGLLPASALLSATSITGYSGGGKQMIADYQAGGPALHSPRPYGLNQQHKHLPEMRVQTGLGQAPVFNPIVGNFLKGLAVTIPLHPSQLANGATPQALQAALAKHYHGEQFIRVLPFGDDAGNLSGGFFDVQGCNDTNRADLFVFGNDERINLICRLDNLGKGAAGAAVQCMNVHLGADEAKGL
ncbi:N-acetyl-gamma-glutamyl-phosphate reductase [Pseudomonas typographi]|uniref:N-acetyl-gamma-glutamyl-phosphate reductase n=1 Tax=Pseudomonas typographi TaxID=2715964 RepID=A0ABR7Z435_9PSED|nr:N-acetyl-gamma-glutamyl-phosphate reductase [Pseudomonas typographi]MBD1552712.1 N-acetyl-gamma-glutamyl-phosphate reductase [Pseudomonas typographi]MBD1588193.1 N-acetyl-gamma-glutamyl-phosphate reductase [Pseudomonas typographi]MBD1600164.1 N-acetyl-gamma-glutamyl-phosphate reductase [Pseudomonas typographi]